jgi:hypothetical protein
MRARSLGPAGRSGGSGKTSSMYSLMQNELMMGVPSCTKVGTTPLGLSAR